MKTRSSNRRARQQQRRSFFENSAPRVPAWRKRSLRIESLEERRVLATLYVDNAIDFAITTDQGAAGLDNGDTVTWNPGAGSQHGAAVAGLTFGTNAFSTIQSAVNAAVDGVDVIRVAGGTFSELVTINKTVDLLGNQVGVDGQTRAAVPETIVNGNAGTTALWVQDDDVEINGFTIRDQTNVNQFGAGVFMNPGTAGLEFRNNIVEFNVIGLFLVNDDGGNPTIIERNIFRQNNNPGAGSGNGIYLDQFTAQGGVNNVVITNNTFQNNNSAGINFSSTNPGMPTTNVTISQNNFDNNGNAISLVNTTNTVITQNNITGSNGSQIYLGGGNSNIDITENFIENGDARGIRINDDVGGTPNTDIVINNNSIENNVGDGLEVEPGSYVGPLNAENNWWGSATGPTSPNNPGGTGQVLDDPSGVVDFSPFLATGVDTQPGTPGFQGNLAITGITVIGTPDDDVVIVTATSENDGTYQVITNGVPGPIVPFTDITSFAAELLGDNDLLRIINPAGGLFAPINGIFYDGGGQAGDALENLGGTAISGVYNPGPTNDAGIIIHVGAAFTQTISFTGLAPAIDTVAELDFTVNGTAAANSISITNGAPGQVTVAVDAFEPISFANKTNVDISGQGGGDSITMNFTAAATGLVTLDLFGHNATAAGDDLAGDTFNLLASPAAVTVVAAGQGGTDYFNNLATLNLDALLGPLTIDGGESLADADVVRLQDSADAGPDTVTIDRSSPTVGTLAGAAGTTINFTNLELFLFESSAAGDTINVLATLTGTSYYVTGNGGGDTVTIGNQTADFNATFDGTLDLILGDIIVTGEFNPAASAVDTLNIDDSGTAAANNASIGINPAFNYALPAIAGGGTDSGPATEVVGFAPAVIRYRHGDSTFLFPGTNAMEFVNVLSGTGNDVIAVNATTATNTTNINTRQGNDAVTIAGDNLSANNLISGFDGTDTFTLNIATHLGATAFAPITGLTINGNDPAATSESRDRLNINDANAGFARNLNFDHLDTAGDLDILPGVAGAGYAGPVNAALAVNVRGMETIVTTSASANDTLTVTGTSADDILTAFPGPAGTALVFLGGNPYLDAPPVSVAGFLPGLAGGGRGPDLLLGGAASVTLDGGAASGEGNRAVVQATSEAPLVTGGTLDIFGFGAGVLVPGAGAGNAYDTINVTDSLVTVSNNLLGALTPIGLATSTFNQTSADTPFQRPGLIVNGGDEAVAQASGISDNITATVSGVFNIQVNGNLPDLVLGPDGLPIGDQLNLIGPGDINIFSDKIVPPTVTVTFSGIATPFGVQHTSIERLLLDAGAPLGTGRVNLIGDNNDPAVDQNDNFVVRGRDVDGNLLDAGYQEMTVVINGSAPILINNVQRLVVTGDDAALTPSVGPNDIDTLDIRAYADNAGNPPNNAPRGWGVDVFFNEGNPPGADGNQADLIIYHTSAGLGGGGSVSENVVLQPSGPDNGEIRATNATDGSVIVTIQYVANTDIIVLDDDGALADTDSLTLNGTNPNGLQTSGRETFAANFAAAGDLANPLVTVTDTATAAILYRLRNFTGFSSITLNPLGGGDTINLTNRAGLTVNVNGGDPTSSGNENDALNMTVAAGARYTQAAVSTEGRIDNTGVGDVNFTGLENIRLITTATGGATFVARGTHDNDTIALDRLGANDLIWINDGPVISFAGFATVDLQGLFGDDKFSISPIDVAVTSILVNGGDPTAAGDEVIVTGDAAANAITYTPTAINGGTVVIGAGPTVTLATVEKLTIDGLGGNDTLNVATPAAVSSDIEITPGSAPDAGTLRVDSLLATGFVNLGAAGALTITDPTAGDRDRVIYNGTAADDIFRVPQGGLIPAPSLALVGKIGVGTAAVEAYVLRGLGGDDRFEVVAQANITVDVQGGDPGASDVLAFTSTGATTINFEASSIDDAGVAGTPDVVYSGIETINLAGNAQALAVVGTTADEDLTVTVYSATAGKVQRGLAVQQSGQVGANIVSPVVNYTNIAPAGLAVDLAGGEDTLVVVGNALAQNWAVDAVAGSIAIDDVPNGVGNDGLVTYTNNESLEVFGLEGNDRFVVTPGAIPVFVDGGDPIGVVPGDSIVVTGAFAYVPGPEVDEGGALSGGAIVSWDHIEEVEILPDANCPFLILGTNADDDITIIARDASYNAAADGIRDFTFSVNAGPNVLIINLPDIPGSADLFVDGQSGDDDLVFRTPAPNDADWDVDVQVAGGPPSIGEPNEGDRLVLETPGEDSIVFTATGPDTGNIVVDEDADLVYTEASTDSRIAFGPFTFVCPDIDFTYVSSPGGVELVEYDGELTLGVATDDITINGTALNDTTTVTPVGAGPGGSGQGSFVSPGSPLFNFRGYDDFTVNGGAGGFDTLIYNATLGADIITSTGTTVTLAGTDVTLGLGLDRFELYSLGGNDNIDLNLTATPLFKKVDAGDGDDIVDLSGSVDADIFGGIGNDTLIGSPAADNIFGGAGNDILIGGGGVDHEYGEDGNDRFGDLLLTGNGVADDPGADFMFGGDGIDQFIWEPGDGSDVIQGGVDGGDILRFFGDLLANAFVVTPAPGAPTHLNTILGGATVDTHGVEQLIVSGLAGADSFTLADLTPTEVESVILVVDTAAGAADTVTVNGRTVSDNVNITVNANGPGGTPRVNIAGLDYDVDIDGIALADADTLTFNGNEGNDTILVDNDPNPLDLATLFTADEVIINAGLGDDFVAGFGTLNGNEGNDTLVGGSVAQTINGGAGDDQIFGGAGADTLLGEAGEDTFVPGFDNALDSIDGGADFDTILVQGNSANNRIDARQDAIGQVRYEISGINGGDGVLGGAGTETDVIVPGTVEELEIQAGSGDDIIRVAHSDTLISGAQQAFSLRFTVDGGAPGTSDRLSVTDDGVGDTTIHRIGGAAGTGSFTVGALAPVVYSDVEFATLNPISPITGGTGSDGLGKLFVFKHDPFEENNSRLNATFLGANETTNVDPTIDPGVDVPFGLPGDEDWYRIVAQHNGTLDIQVYFDQQGLLLNGRAGLPGEGNLEIALYDADGLVTAGLIPGEIAGTGAFGTNDTTDDERIRIPAVAGQTYYLRVLGAPFVGNVVNASPAINVYNIAVVNTPAETPIDLELDDRIIEGAVAALGTTTSFDSNLDGQFPSDFFNGKVVSFKFATPTTPGIAGEEALVIDYDGPSGVFTLSPTTPLSAAPAALDTFQVESVDTGRHNNDNITRDNTPTIFLRVPNVINVGGVANLDDLPYNGSAPGEPPDQFIGIPHISSVLLDVPATAAGFRVAIFVTERGTSDQGPPNNVLAGYAQPVDPVNRPGVFSFTFGSAGSFITSLTPDGSYFVSARVEMIDPAQSINPVAPNGPDNQEQAQGYGALAQSLEIFVDTTPPPVSFGDPGVVGDGLTADSDTFVIPNPETIIDLVTNDLTPTFWGRAEADATVRLFADAFVDLNANGVFDFVDVNGNDVFDAGDIAIDTPPNGVFDPNTDLFIGQTTAIPLDGNQQEPNGFWKIESVINFNDPRFFIGLGGTRTVFVTAEDVAGNVNDNVAPQELDVFIDVQGPQITDVTVNAPSGSIDDVYNLFDPKPSTDGPTPLVNSIFIEIQDLPLRDLPGFDSPAFKPDIAENPGHYLITGDYNGIIPILDVNVFLDPAVDGAPATGRVELVFRTEGPDGIFNTSDDIGAALPDDRFTLFVNDDGIVDFAGNKLDGESNADEPHDSPPGPGEPDVLGVDGVPTGDGVPGGDFLARFTVDTRPELGVWANGAAFLDINGNTIWDPDNADFTNRDITHMLGYVSDDLFAGQFARVIDGVLTNDGFDKLAAYGRVGNTSFRWLIDTDNDGVANIERVDPANINGLPVAGNFAIGLAGDEVGLFTGTTWHFDTNQDYRVDTSLPWPVAGHPIVGDFDGDGRDDLGTWTNDVFSFDLSSINSAAGGLPGNAGIDGTVEKTFKFGFTGTGERPVAADMNQDGIEDVGLWMPANDGIEPRGQAEWYFLISGVTQNDTQPGVPANLGPTITGSNDPTPGAYNAVPGTYGLTNYTKGRIVVDPLFPSQNVVRFQPVPFGNDQHYQFGDEFALPIVGNFDPPVTSASTDTPPDSNPRNQHDVNNDGKVNGLDLLSIVNHLTVNGAGPAPTGFSSGPFVDTNQDSQVNVLDLLAVINYLTTHPINLQDGGAGEGEGSDEFFSQLGSGSGQDDGDELLDLLASGN